MGDMLDYIDWRGDLSFAERPLNEVDNLIFSELAYITMDEIVSERGESVSVKELYRKYREMEYNQSDLINDPYETLKRCAASRRFGDLRVRFYSTDLDTERQVQFAAATFMDDSGLIYIAFRGTDNTLVGWREDFNTAFMDQTPAQYDAVTYLNRVMGLIEGDVYCGGHSKGGNLAVYASAFCREEYRKRIIRVYSNDGPGFNETIAASPEYMAVLDKVELIMPECSMIGVILENKKERKLVNSSAEGGMQHDPYTWLVQRDRFEYAEEASPLSQLLDKTLDQWLQNVDDEKREEFVNAIFDAVEASGVSTFAEMNSKRMSSYNAILKAAMKMDPEVRNSILETLKKLAIASKDIIFDETKQAFEEAASHLQKRPETQ